MVNEDIKKVKQYLYSISRLELSIANIKNSIEDLRERVEGDPTLKSTIYDKIVVSGGESISKPESNMLGVEQYLERIKVLEICLERQEKKLCQFYNAMEALAHESHMGYLAANIVRHKYIQRIAPDYRIYTLKLFCSRRTFYKAHKIALQFFLDVIPELK